MADQDLTGKVFGRCRILRKLGSGGMGSVYLARHETLDKEVALKVIAPEFADNAEIVQRMLREAKLAAKLEHPNVVQVHDAAIEAGIPYIVMQYVDGRTLQQVLDEKKRLPPKDALTITKRVALALSAAHKLGIVHRDIKPANVLLSRDGMVKVADFGLARGSQPGEASLTTKDIIVGTPHYMAPEQARGEKVDARTDLYSLGATLYAMLTGGPPFAGETALAVAMQQADPRARADDPRTRVKDLPEPVVGIVLKLLAKPPEERFQSAEEVVRAVDALTQPAAAGKKRLWIWPAAAALAALAALAFLLRPSPAEKLYREAEATMDLEKAIFKHREVQDRYPKTDWAAKSAARVKDLQAKLDDEREMQALKTAAEFWKTHGTEFKAARKPFEGFLEQHPSSKRVPEARAALTEIHTAELKARYVDVERIFQSGNPGDLVEFVDPEVIKSQGTINLRRLLGGTLKIARDLGWEVEKVRAKSIKLEESLTQAEIEAEIETKNRKTGEKKVQVDPHVWVLRNDTWYIDPDKSKKRK